MNSRKLDLRIEKNKERLIDGLVKAIIVYDDHFEVFLTFDDTPITIPTSEEIESMKNEFGHRICHFTKSINPHSYWECGFFLVLRGFAREFLR